MKNIRLAAVFTAAILLTSGVVSEDEIDEKDVVVLTEANFDDTLAKHKFALVEFYAPWCGHCKNLKPAWAEAATKLKEHDSSVLIAKVDATEERDLGKRFEITGFPSIKWFVDGQFVADYSSGRTAADIVNWVKKKSGPPSKLIEDKDALKKAKDEEVSVFGFFGKLEGDAHEAFEKFASTVDDAAFFKVTDASLAKELGLTTAPSFAVARSYAGFDLEVVSSVDHSAFAEKDQSLQEKLAAFLKAEKLPAFLEFGPTTQGKIFGSGIDHHVIIAADSKDLEAGAELVASIKAAATKARGKTILVTCTKGSETCAPVMSFFGLDSDSKEPEIVGFFAKSGVKYAFPEGKKIDGDNLAAFAGAVVDGTAAIKTKSAPIPDEPEEEGVTVVVGSTFEQIVMDPTKDVLLEVYAPWCGHCKSLAPTYAKLAKRFKKIDSVVVAKMDGTENEVASLTVQGFPTLKFYPAEKDAQPIDFDAGRDLASMTKFIKKHAKIPYELPKRKKADAGDEQGEYEEQVEEEGELAVHEEL